MLPVDLDRAHRPHSQCRCDGPTARNVNPLRASVDFADAANGILPGTCRVSVRSALRESSNVRRPIRVKDVGTVSNFPTSFVLCGHWRKPVRPHFASCRRTRPTSSGETEVRHSDTVQLPGPLQSLHDTERQNAAPVNCHVLLGPLRPDAGRNRGNYSILTTNGTSCIVSARRNCPQPL